MSADPWLPEYDRRSLAEVVPSLLAALGVPGMVNTLEIAPAQRVCLLLVDGLGEELRAEYAADAPFLTSLGAGSTTLTAGFPATTVTSLTSLGTGSPPGTHGIFGTTFRIEPDGSDRGELLNALRWTTHDAEPPVDLRLRLPPEEVQPAETTLERAAAAGVAVTTAVPHHFRNTGLTRAALRGGEFRGVHALGDLAATAIGAITGVGPRYCYAYHGDLDTLGHIYGPGSAAWRLQLRQIDHLAESIAERLPPDGLLAVTADHGMVDVAESMRIDADTDDALRAGVALIGGEPRARHVYAEPGAAPDVLAAWQERLGALAWVLPRDEAVSAGWFGAVSENVRDRIGDVVVAMRGTAAVVRSKAERTLSTLPGQHGSLTAAEQLIPLRMARSE